MIPEIDIHEHKKVLKKFLPKRNRNILDPTDDKTEILNLQFKSKCVTRNNSFKGETLTNRNNRNKTFETSTWLQPLDREKYNVVKGRNVTVKGNESIRKHSRTALADQFPFQSFETNMGKTKFPISKLRRSTEKGQSFNSKEIMHRKVSFSEDQFALQDRTYQHMQVQLLTTEGTNAVLHILKGHRKSHYGKRNNPGDFVSSSNDKLIPLLIQLGNCTFNIKNYSCLQKCNDNCNCTLLQYCSYNDKNINFSCNNSNCYYFFIEIIKDFSHPQNHSICSQILFPTNCCYFSNISCALPNYSINCHYNFLFQNCSNNFNYSHNNSYSNSYFIIYNCSSAYNSTLNNNCYLYYCNSSSNNCILPCNNYIFHQNSSLNNNCLPSYNSSCNSCILHYNSSRNNICLFPHNSSFNRNNCLLSNISSCNNYCIPSYNYSCNNCSETVLHAPTFQTHTLVKGLVLLIIAILSLVGNLGTLLSICRRGRQKTTSSTVYILLFQLALADLLVTLFCILAEALWTLTVEWRGGDLLCRLLKFLQMFSLYLSTFVLVLIGFDRLGAVRFPMHRAHARTHVRRGIAAVWTMSALFSAPQVRNSVYWMC
ncbi:hypothetical protein JTE90_018443 [Oedothorax gibbosus]|uniref:G-protein coupled receptors family 1 profile domain-containing protein n=1 Tax=Oedothorax gibbosus TaxID=931172 RepID=A0AAV6V0S8_9ARAC|nr:hypothetical protein JTE90_018443 [Oedothorax gibbosus]